MYSVLFEVQPKQECFADYLRLASTLKPQVDRRRVDGLIDNERFEDTRRPGWLLSHSLWRDEKAVTRWQATVEHHAAQAHGRAAIFANYHLRVGDVCYDSHPPSRAAVSRDRAGRMVRAEPATRMGRWATLTELARGGQAADAAWREQLPARLGLPVGSADLLDYSVFASIYTPGKLALLVSWASYQAASAWRPALADEPAPRHRTVRIVRDHGMYD